ncbi:MAG: S41 family peptidase [Marinifilaceae bacterium]
MRKILCNIALACTIVLVAFWLYLSREKGHPRENFEFFFQTFRENYALFDVKNIDWDNLHAQYAYKVNGSTTDEDLYQIFQEILQKLDDKHCYIYRFNEIYFSGFGLPSLNYWDLLSFDFRLPTNDFSLKLIEEKYLSKGFEKSLRIHSLLPPIGMRDIFTTGWLRDSIAYIHMTEMSNKSEEVHNAISGFFEKYQKADGFVVDVRDNIGGYSMPAKEIAESFADEKRLYAISRVRKPNNIYSYKNPEYWTIQPNSGINLSNRPVALLINENTQSAAELFTLMMKALPNVKLIGDTTSGVFADTHIGKLPNGWEYRLSVRKTNDCNDNPLEDIGIAPDTTILNSKEDLEQGKDKVIEYAINSLSSNLDKEALSN